MALLEDGLLVAVGAVALSVVYLSGRNRPGPGTTPLAALMATIAAWAVVHLFEHHSTGPLQDTLEMLEWVMIVPLAFIWFVFVLEYAGYGDRLDRRHLAALFAWPSFLVVAVWFPETTPVLGEVSVQLATESGPVFWGHVGLSYGLLTVGTVLLVYHVRTQPRVFRLQVLAILAGLVAAWVGSAVSIFEPIEAIHLHALPVGLVVMGVFFLWAIVRQDLTALSPVAHRTIMDSLAVGVLTVDAAGRVTSANPATRRLLDIPDGRRVVGERLAAIDPTGGELVDLVGRALDADGTDATVEHDGRHITCEVAPLSRRGGRSAGAAVLLTDVTDRRRDRRCLERQNERLDRFASVVSHDLRNPLTVARGRIDLAREADDADHLGEAADALGRMEAIIDDVLSLAREGDTVGVLEPVDLDEAVEVAWRSVGAGDASLDVAVDGTIRANRSRLRRLLENLLRNPVDHVGDDVSITVGGLSDGFYVADDGSGIPADDRDEVFTVGYSTAEGGTGLGLAIVHEIAQAHGWSVTATEGADGGARFEIRGVDRID